MVISNLVCLRGTSAMRCCAGVFMGNSLSDPKDLLIPFLGHLPLAVDNWSPSEPICAFHKTFVYKKKVLPTPRG
jgi:hypothetical protein